MKKIIKYFYTVIATLWLAGVFSFIPEYISAQPVAETAAKELRIRKGLPNFFNKIESGKPITIAYFGGSITEAADGWREQSTTWLQRQYPKTKINSINAAIGGTGSDLAVFRLRQHVLVHHPDLVFIEFAVNDSKKQPQEIYKAIEGIVRQIWQANMMTDICFVYTLTAEMAPILQQGKLPTSASAMEHIADFYHIPSVHMGMEIARLAKKNELIFKGKPADYSGKMVFSADNVHPYPQTGHRLYTEALVRSLQEIAKTNRTYTRKLGKALMPDNWEKAKMMAVTEIQLPTGWQVLRPEMDTVARQLQNRFSCLIKADKSAETWVIRFKGTRFGLYDVMGPGCGQYEIKVDGKQANLYPRFDEYCTYYRANYFFLPELEDSLHTVEIKVSHQPLDKAAILAKRDNIIDNAANYIGNACYASQLMVIGELVK